VAVLACAWQVLAVSIVCAQGILQKPNLPDPEETGRFRLGFIRFTPSVVVNNLGVDTNVFNELEDPKEDFTASFGPKAEFWTRFGPRMRIYGSVGVDYQYFQEYDSQRSFGTSNVARLELDLGRLTPFAEAQYTNSRARPGFEIDARARHEDFSGRAGAALRVGGKTQLVGWARREQFRYDDAGLASTLSQALDRDSTFYGGGPIVAVTPLTTFLLELEAGEDRFVHSPERNADTWKVMPEFRFKPFALIDGRLALGYRQFDTVSALVPDYGGLIAAVDLGYTLRATRFNGQYNRDVTYSIETVEPYYLQTDWNFQVTQKITSTWDVVGRAGRYELSYETVALPGLSRRRDEGKRFGGGIGYTLGQYMRLGFDVNYIDRTSDADITRNYEGVRAGFAVSYGLKQR
jgi:hypothetical protein